MKNIVYIAPFPMATTMKFALAIGALPHARLLGIFQAAPAAALRASFAEVIVVKNALDVDRLEKAVRIFMVKYGKIDKILGILEQLQEPLALLRVRLGVAGMTPKQSHLFRDKAAMKSALRKAGIPCARYRKIQSVHDAWAFIDEVGFPIVLKPPTGAGCRATYRISNPGELVSALQEIPVRPVLAEEFLTGAEYSMETFTLHGVPRFYSFSRYYPSPLEVMQNSHIQWVVLFPHELEKELFQQAKDVGYAAIKALGLDTGMTHMEWFRRPDGSVAIGEIGARPPGAQFSDAIGLIHGVDIFHVWARLMVDEHFDRPLRRQSAAALAFLRGRGHGKIVAIQGLAEAQKKMGKLVVASKLPQVGVMRSSGYEGDGWVLIQHPDTEVVKRAALELITTVQIRYQY